MYLRIQTRRTFLQGNWHVIFRRYTYPPCLLYSAPLLLCDLKRGYGACRRPLTFTSRRSHFCIIPSLSSSFFVPLGIIRLPPTPTSSTLSYATDFGLNLTDTTPMSGMMLPRRRGMTAWLSCGLPRPVFSLFAVWRYCESAPCLQ